MLMIKLKKHAGILVILTLVLISSCYTILSVVQPSNANVGETITTTIDLEMDETGLAGSGPSYGLTAIMMPTDWTVVEVSYDGDYGPSTMAYLHPDSIDIQPGAGTDYWYDSLVVNYPPPAGMDWYVYEGTESHVYLGGITNVTATYQLTTGAAGNYNIGYYVNNADLHFNDPDYTGDISLDNAIVVGVTGIEDEQDGLANGFALAQNFPNPFNPSTTIRYQLNERGLVNMSVYDLTGKKVAELINSVKNAGSHEIKFDATDLPSGVYFYKITAGSSVQMKKMILMK
jgi:hypothetical protein